MKDTLFVSGIATFVQCRKVGPAALENGTFGSFQNLGIAALVLILIVLFNRSSNRYFRMESIIIGITTGGLAAIISNMVIRIKEE